jgi:hypothetical protein
VAVTRLEAWLLHVANLLVGGTGLVYAWMRYLARPADEFALVNHPLQPTVQHAHVLAAPLLVFAVGMIWRRHVAARVLGGHRPRRRTGLGLALSLAPMVASGYLLQTASGEGWRTAWIAVHLATSGLWLAAYGVHLAARRYALVRGSVDARPSEPELGVALAPRSRSASGTRG